MSFPLWHLRTVGTLACVAAKYEHTTDSDKRAEQHHVASRRPEE